MSETPEQDRSENERSSEAQGNSVLRFLEAKTGDAPRINLRDEDSASVSAPVIDPGSKEKLSIPRGRGNYQLMGEIARGGMGVVLKGHDTDLGRDIAVKVLDKRLCERMDVVQRFVEEAQIGGQLQHPGIVPVYELGLMEDERPYFTMKLVKGRTLATLLKQRETPASNRGSLIDTFESVCQTMGYAHSRGVIHRDLKPANIMVGAFGEVQVVDWGLAKVLARGGLADERRASDADVTRTILETVRSEGSGSGSQSQVGSVLGTPAYMPPEQARGQVDQFDERSDVFALGAILCEILTGSAPYLGEPDEIIAAAAQAELDGAYERLDACGADAALIKATKHCLMAAPAARPADAGILAERIRDYVQSTEERAHRAEVEAAEARVTARQEHRARRLTLALGAAVLAIVVIAGGGWLWAQNERTTQQQARIAREQALGDKVNQALNEAAVHEGAARWDEALAAAERAHALAQGGDASGELLAAVALRRTEVREALARAQRDEEFRRDTRRLVTELQRVAQPDDEYGSGTGKKFGETFLAHGIDLDADDLETAAEQLTRRGLGSDVALVLDAWADTRRIEGNAAGARRLLQLAHRVDPDPDRARLRDAVAAGNLDQLRKLATTGLGDQPASTYALLATSVARLEDRDLALALYRGGLERYPHDFQLHYLFAVELSKVIGRDGIPVDADEAQLHLRAALAIEPESSWTRHRLARLHTQMREFALAIEQFDLALELDPDNLIHVFWKAGALQNLGRLDESDALYERCVACKEPEWVSGWSISSLAESAAVRGDHQRALELARRSWTTNASIGSPIRAFMCTPYLIIARDTGDESTLLEAEKQFEREFGNSPEAVSLFPWAMYYVANDLVRGWTNIDGEDPGTRLLLTHAREWFRKGRDLVPDNARNWRGTAITSYLLGDADTAVAALAKQNDLDDADDPENWLLLALSHHARGDEKQAREWYERAIAFMAANPVARASELQSSREAAARLIDGK